MAAPARRQRHANPFMYPTVRKVEELVANETRSFYDGRPGPRVTRAESAAVHGEIMTSARAQEVAALVDALGGEPGAGAADAADDPNALPGWYRGPYRLTPKRARDLPKDGKYFVYQPTGGWGNQRLEMLYAICNCLLWNRTLILPAVAAHTNGWTGYQSWTKDQLLSAADVLDIEHMNALLPTLAWGGTLAELQEAAGHLSWSITSKPRTGQWSWGRIRGSYIRNRANVIYWNKASMFMCCAHQPRMKDAAATHITFSPRIRAVARRATAKLGLPDFAWTDRKGVTRTYAGYNAIHVRRGDHKNYLRRRPDWYMRRMGRGGLIQIPSGYGESEAHRASPRVAAAVANGRLPVYVATDEKNRAWFDPFKIACQKPGVCMVGNRNMKWGGYELFFAEDLDFALLERELFDQLPAETRNDVLGFVEQVVTARSWRFSGAGHSTFSYAINFSRRHMKEMKMNE